MKKPELSQRYWMNMAKNAISSFQAGDIDEQTFYAWLYLTHKKLKEWQAYGLQKKKAVDKRKRSKAARKQNRKGK